jgi:hypothetical protein
MLISHWWKELASEQSAIELLEQHSETGERPSLCDYALKQEDYSVHQLKVRAFRLLCMLFEPTSIVSYWQYCFEHLHRFKTWAFSGRKVLSILNPLWRPCLWNLTTLCLHSHHFSINVQSYPKVYQNSDVVSMIKSCCRMRFVLSKGLSEFWCSLDDQVLL